MGQTASEKLGVLLEKLQALTELLDVESAHSKADAMLCDALQILRQDEIVEAYKKVTKWYA